MGLRRKRSGTVAMAGKAVEEKRVCEGKRRRGRGEMGSSYKWGKWVGLINGEE